MTPARLVGVSTYVPEELTTSNLMREAVCSSEIFLLSYQITGIFNPVYHKIGAEPLPSKTRSPTHAYFDGMRTL
jgi:hypothetical protein